MAQIQRYNPENVMSNKRILGFKKRNFAEAIIEIFLFLVFLTFIPFVVKVRWIILICGAAGIALANFIGVQGNSPTQALIMFIRYRKQTNIRYSYRRFSDDTPRGNVEVISNGKVKIFRSAESTRRVKSIIGL